MIVVRSGKALFRDSGQTDASRLFRTEHLPSSRSSGCINTVYSECEAWFLADRVQTITAFGIKQLDNRDHILLPWQNLLHA